MRQQAAPGNCPAIRSSMTESEPPETRCIRKRHARPFPGAACCQDLRPYTRRDEYREVFSHMPKRLPSRRGEQKNRAPLLARGLALAQPTREALSTTSLAHMVNMGLNPCISFLLKRGQRLLLLSGQNRLQKHIEFCALS
jgi:hypothetical protein